MRRRHVTGLSLLFLGQLGIARKAQAARPLPAEARRQRSLHVIGDSTAAEFAEADPRVGWGAMLASQLMGLTVNDAARSGRSSKSFRDEGHFDSLTPHVAPGDLLLIQFGHNDEKDDAARATDPATTFRDNLRRYVADSRRLGAVPVLLTPISRRRFEGEHITPSHGAFPDATRAVAAETDTPLIDLTEKTRQVLERFGPDASERLFAPDDNTHLSAAGALVVARLVVSGLNELGLGVTPRAHAPSLEYFAAPIAKAPRAAVVICPGGGYTHLADVKEGSNIAAWLNGLGIDAFLLRYRLADFGHPAPLDDVLAALRLVRAHADRYGVATDRIGVLGCSAGGHLAACASCLFTSRAERPDFAILAYPVITLESPYAHAGSRCALLGPAPESSLVEALSLETRVSSATPPTFLMHTRDDASVPVENSQLYRAALERAGVASELHVYEHGPHGVGLNPEHEAGREWPKACAAWLRARGLGTGHA